MTISKCFDQEHFVLSQVGLSSWYGIVILNTNRSQIHLFSSLELSVPTLTCRE